MFFSFFFNDTATPDIYTLSLHDALPICLCNELRSAAIPERGITLIAALSDRRDAVETLVPTGIARSDAADRKSTRLNSSHLGISYAVFCLKKKNKIKEDHNTI